MPFIVRVGRAWKRSGIPSFALLLLALAGASRTADAQGVRYTLTPGVDYVRWDNAFGLEDTYLYGGRVSFDFGPLISLQPYYFTRDNVRADPANAGDSAAFVGFAARDVDVRHYGANLQLNLGTGTVIPFLRAGGGILRFKPNGGDRTDQISLLGGGGLRFDVGSGIGADIFAQDVAFRMNRFRLYTPAGAVLPPDPDANELRHNLVVGAGVNIPLGGGFSQASQASGLRGVAIPVEPFIGRLDYDGDTGLDKQYLVGVRSGIDFSSLFGMRGFYWRGVNDNFDATQKVQGYGGEAQFNLNSGPGISPFLVAGAGRIDYLGGFRSAQATRPPDRTALILGGGVGIGLSERLRLNASVRDYIFDRNTEFQDVRNTRGLLHNPLYSAGFTFSLGGRRPTVESLRSPEIERLRAQRDSLRAENERLRNIGPDTVFRVDTVQVGRNTFRVDTVRAVRAPAVENGMRVDTVVVNERGERMVRETVRNAQGERTITIPVPATGEIYIRYGEPGAVRVNSGMLMDTLSADSAGLSRTQIRRIIRDEVQREDLVPASDTVVRDMVRGRGLSAEQMDVLERRLADRVDRRLRGERLLRNLSPTEQTVVVPGRAGEVPLPAYGASGYGAYGAYVDNARLAEMEQRLNQRVDALVDQRVRAELARRDQRMPRVSGAPVNQRVVREWIYPADDTAGAAMYHDTTIVTDAVVPATEIVPPAPVVAPPAVARRPYLLGLRQLQPYVGVSLSPTQALLGLRLDAGGVTAGSPIRIVPEVAVGFGGGSTSLLAAANLQYTPGGLFFSGFSPYVSAGLGVLSRDGTKGVVDVGIGLAADVDRGPFGRTVGFLEYQGIKLFDESRVLVGLRLGAF